MAELIQQYATLVEGPGGVWYASQVWGEGRTDGTWEGWIEFHPAAPPGIVLRTERETTQPNRDALAYWASGLEPIYFDGALARAL